jgi:phage baseplate assembly protein W
MTNQLAGFAFPFRFDVQKGGLSRADGFQKIEQNVRHLLSTRLGERVMLRTYGGGVHQRLQSPNDSTLRALVKHEIEEALQVYMPEVRLVAPIKVNAQEEVLTIILEYRADPRDVVRRLELQLP